ncbi:hypothetical protein K7X08_018453 [Anisodus acutangulus]|uniref:LOB domain-containing protein n=1 Tax=Anisodus acutangulus TaxID=402998 RepID=A0A9Q1LYH9_9SOLA|nr:hypothetical protein K7X08_018453 [Anisodus acutangulus]
MESSPSSSSVITSEDVMGTLMNDGTIDSMRLKIITQLKANEELKNTTIKMVEQSRVLNTPGAEKQTKRELFDALRQELETSVLEKASKSVWELILDNNGIGKEISETVEQVFCRLSGREAPLFVSDFGPQPEKGKEKKSGQKEESRASGKDNSESAAKKRKMNTEEEFDEAVCKSSDKSTSSDDSSKMPPPSVRNTRRIFFTYTGSTYLAIFRSLLYEACGRIVNPIYGSVGLLWSGNWQLCQNAVEAVLKGAPITPIASEVAVNNNGPPLKLPYDIRHINKDDNSTKSNDLHRVRTRCRFKRSGAKTKVTKENPVCSGSGDESAHEKVNGSTSHESSLSHQSEAAAAAPNVECDSREIESFHSPAEPTEDGDIELELTLGFAPFATAKETKRSEAFHFIDAAGECKMELGLHCPA